MIIDSEKAAPSAPTPMAEPDALPAYSATPTPTASAPRSERVEHVFEQRKDGADAAWLTLRLPSRARKASSLPYFMEGEPVEGVVVLNLDKPDYVLGITLSIEGGLASNYVQKPQDEFRAGSRVFLEQTENVWTASGTGSPGFFDRLRGREGERLEGQREFPFNFSLPKTVRADDREDPLPSAWMERGARCSVSYLLTLKVKRPGLALDGEISTYFGYCPSIAPGPFSLLRQAAYESGSGALVGPAGDPEGWTSLKPVTLTGTLFSDRQTEVTTTLSLANPLTYTRGTVIPVHLSISSTDTQALDLFSAASAPIVRLLAHVTYHNKKQDEEARAALAAAGAVQRNASYYGETRVLQRATWFAPAPGAEGTRELLGEIHVDVSLKPALSVPEFETSYSVALCPFSAPGFVLSAINGRPLSSDAIEHADDPPPITGTPVSIATTYGEGARPCAVTPPSYEQARPWPIVAFSYERHIPK